MPFLVILTWIKDNWLPIALIALVAAAYFYGHSNGVDSAREECQVILQKEHDDAEKKRQFLQTDADNKAAEYEADRTKYSLSLVDIKRRLAHDQTLNAAYSTCHTGPNFLFFYADTAGANSGSKPSR